MISPAAAELIRRARTQLENGIANARRGDVVLAEAWFNAGLATLDALHALLDEPAQKQPLRRLVVVGPREGEAEPLPQWMTKKHGGNDGNAA